MPAASVQLLLSWSLPRFSYKSNTELLVGAVKIKTKMIVFIDSIIVGAYLNDGRVMSMPF